MSDYVIREASTEAERAAAYRLRYALYVEAQGLFGGVADHERRWLHDDEDREATVWIATVGDETVGTSRMHWGDAQPFGREIRENFDIDAFEGLVDEREMAVGSRLLVVPAYRTGLLPLQMLLRMLAKAVERGAEILFGECEPHLVNKWTRLGFRSYGLCEHPVNGTLVRLALLPGDREHLERLESPLLSALGGWSKQSDTHRRLAARLQQSQQIVSEVEGRTRFWAKVEQTLSREALQRLFGGLTEDELDTLLGNGHALDCDPGSVLIRKGHVSRTLFVLLTGSLLIRDEGEIVAEVREPGEIIGEVAFFTNADRMSDVLAGSEGAQVLALSERNLGAVIDVEGTGAAKFLMALTRGLCHKLRQRSRRPAASSGAPPP